MPHISVCLERKQFIFFRNSFLNQSFLQDDKKGKERTSQMDYRTIGSKTLPEYSRGSTGSN